MFIHQSHLEHLLRPDQYFSAEQHETELRHLFEPAWHPVTTAHRLARPGDFLTLDLFGRPILLRNMDGELCAFLNVCPHRHSRLTDKVCGNTEKLKCQYHGERGRVSGRMFRTEAAKPLPRAPRTQRTQRQDREEIEGGSVTLF